MKRIVFLLLTSLKCFVLLGQTELISIKINSSLKLLDIDGVPHLLTTDSIYKIRKNSIDVYPLEKGVHKLSHVEDSLFINRGGGSVYKLNSNFELDTLLYAPKMETSFYHSAKFIHNDTLVSFGGYGNFSFNNSFTYFHSNLKTWLYYPDFTLENNKPPPASVYLPWNYSDGVFTIYRILHKVNGGAESRNVSFSMFQYHFDKKQWITKKSVSKLENLFNISLGRHHGNGFMIFNLDNRFFLFDCNRSLIEEYQKTTPLFSNLISFLILDNSIYTLNKEENGFKVFKTSLNVFLSNKINSESVIDAEINHLMIYCIIVFIVVFLILLFFKFKSASSYFKIKNELKDLENELPDVQFKFLQELVESYPRAVHYKFILSLFDDSIGYEAKKIKIRKTVKDLNNYLETKLDLKKPLVTRRSSEDRRQFEVYVKD